MNTNAFRAASAYGRKENFTKVLVLAAFVALALFVVCGLLANQAYAAELEAAAELKAQDDLVEYSVWVGGVQVTSANKGNVLSDNTK